MHRCELPGNYPVFTVVMVIYTFVRRISIITLPPIFLNDFIYIYIPAIRRIDEYQFDDPVVIFGVIIDHCIGAMTCRAKHIFRYLVEVHENIVCRNLLKDV